MRNLKRALSLTLASVMLLGMMVVGSSAAAGYDDVKETDNVEAIEVLQAVQVMVGDDRGFGPERPVNRAEMAVVMGKLLNLDYNYYSATCPFNDVYDWARGWVGACAANGIVSGRGNGVYDPGATVTAVEAASMLMRALGYFKYSNDYADGFEVSTVRQGTNIGIFDGVGSSATEPMTRNQVAQMALNALKSGVVQPDGNTINLTTPDGSVYTGKVNYVYVTSNKAFAGAISTVRASSMGSANDAPIVELGEQLYDGKLKLNANTTDAFQRPSRYWEFDGKAIGTYVKKELLKAEYTTEVTGKQLYDLLGKDIIADYTFTCAVDGEQTQAVLDGNAEQDKFFFSDGNMIRTNTKSIGGTGNGVLTQVFVDPDELTSNGRLGRGTVYVTVINTYLAKALDDYDAKREEAEFEVYSLEKLTNGELVKNVKNTQRGGSKAPAELKVKNEDINVENVKDDDIVLVHVAEGEIKEILAPEVIAETEISSFKNGKWVNNGTQYDYAHATSYDPKVLNQYVNENMKDVVYNLYLDKYGYMIGIELVDAKLNYLFLTGIDGSTSNLANKTAQGNVILLDGTMDTVTIKLGDSKYADGHKMSVTNVPVVSGGNGPCSEGTYHQLNSLMNTWCSYTVDANGAYVLKEVARTGKQYNPDPATKKPQAKAGQSHVSNDYINGVDVSAEKYFTLYNEIDKKHVSTLGIPYAVGDDAALRVAYGTDDSIYLNVSTNLIRATRPNVWSGQQNNAIIIDDVDSVATGVQNVSIKALSAYQVWLNTNTTVINNVTGGHNGVTDNQLDSVAHGVYNLFDDDGAIIAAVVVGEDDSASTGYAYVISDKMNQESWDKTKGEWTWSREVIVNGEITNLTQVKSSNDDPDISANRMLRGYWYEIKYKADGTVKSAELISWDENKDNVPIVGGYDTPAPTGMKIAGEFIADYAYGIGNDTAVLTCDGTRSKFVGLVRKVESAVTNPGVTTVVLATDLTGSNATAATNWISTPSAADGYYSIDPDTRWNAAGNFTNYHNLAHNKLTTTGNTLWIENAYDGQKDGFAVRNDAKVVLVQDTHTILRNGQIKTDVMANRYEYSVTGKEALAKMLKDLEDNKNFVGFVGAVFEGGVATSVVIWDQTPENIQTYDPTYETPGSSNYYIANRVMIVARDVATGARVGSDTYNYVVSGEQITLYDHWVGAPAVHYVPQAGHTYTVNFVGDKNVLVLEVPYVQAP